ncbi:MAG: 30S ribosomal protein S11 [Candidatus Pacebacteria bacterium RIFCSPHIGHO2_01_FULL_46_16]|nr:MAG: 30S ribosomal protein S11 [Candidatus Pacebacteria bacterium RIFCSPHIGHO2_01_FULL_46_16]OGJ22137.1 MAG: 30S ribosomal protein S11 [Candidatus Pacebacteria bacterium RIFCSPHIGHO2_02_FULL_46_9]OGJ38257.1 MAG: 30S ribosomal protein S11 [Candidatus Pacebacteria bacterium RIFCSPLOWO2_01_FULL_47_12]
MANTTQPPVTSKKKQRLVASGRLYVTATFNTTLVSVTDERGNVLCWSSAGEAGFTGSRKSTPYAATITLENAVNKARAFGMQNMELYIKGPGPGRDVALRVLKAQGIRINLIADMTPSPHNGTRPRKAKHNK